MPEKETFDDKYVQTAFLILESKLLRLKTICAIQNKSMANVLRELADDYINQNSNIIVSISNEDKHEKAPSRK